MKRFLRFALLAVIGFVLGGGVAYLTKLRQPQPLTTSSAGSNSAATSSSGTSVEMTTDTNGRGHLKLKTDPLQDKIDAAKKGEDAPKVSEGLTDADATVAPAPAKPVMRHVSPNIGLYVPGTFSLTDTEGRIVTEKSFPGKFLLVFFGFTHCPDICPVTLDKMRSAMDKLGDLAGKVQPIFITIDPVRDTPEALKAYSSHYAKGLVALTGTDSQIADAEQSYKVVAEKAPLAGDDYTFDHSAYVYLMSPENRLEEVLRIEQGTDAVVAKIRPYLDGSAKQKPLMP
ncbi:MAG: SCO family protein [Micavibrio sp.]|nr:SCO family protein [Micavibrio sp.]